MRKYTLDYYLEFLSKQNSTNLFFELKDYAKTIISNIQARYKTQTKGAFIDYISQYEDFYLITTYRIEDMLTCAFTVIRIKNGKKHFQYYERFNFWGVYEWRRHKMNHFYKRYLYSRNLKSLFAGTEYQYSAIWELAEKIDVSARNFLGYCNADHLKYIECLTKMKCFKLARDVINGRFYNRRFNHIFKDFGCNNYLDFKFVIDNDLNYLQFRRYNNYKSFNLENKYYKLFRSYCDCFSFDSFKFNHISSKALVKYYLFLIESKNIKTNFRDFIRDYRDYCSFGKDLGYDFTNTKYSKPNDFQVAHDLASMKYQSKKAMVQKKDFTKIVRKIKKFAYVGEKYSIVVPKTPEDIVLEGKNMCNCVGGYIDRIIKGNSFIFFVRRSNQLDKSFYTLEIKPGTLEVVQCRGYHNNPSRFDKPVLAFVNKWLKDCVKKTA